MPYYFVKNLQGDVIAIVNKDAETVARYAYDAWGVPTITQDTSSCQIATVNPFRYRGYYYDEDISMYYLQSRYYDPEVGRFINADDAGYVSFINENICSLDLFVYCCNDFPNCSDPTGYWHLDIRADALVLAIDLLIYLLPLIPPINKALSKLKYLPKYATKTWMTAIKNFLIKVLPKVNVGLAVLNQLIDWIDDLTGLFPFGASIGGLVVWGLSKICKTWTKKERAFIWFGPITNVTYIRIF